jgi:methylase of polypeptide subunit release factors
MTHPVHTATPRRHISWIDGEETRRALWCAPGAPPPAGRLAVVDDTLTADQAFRLASQGIAMLWRGDYRNARQLLVALAHRIDRRPGKRQKPGSPRDAFNQYRLAQSQRANLLNQLLVPMDPGGHVALRHAPDVQAACRDALGEVGEPFVVSLRALQGMVGAFEWRRKGVAVPGLDLPVHVHYGVFSPIRGEYLSLVAQAPLPATDLAFDIGTGSGVLAAILARRGVPRVIATDLDPRALDCARENIRNQGLAGSVTVQEADLFPAGTCGLIVCNPPWLPARPTTPMESAIYDPDSRMLQGFLDGLASHLAPGGEGWLILSDLAERLGLRDPGFLPEAIARAGLRVAGRLDTRPRHAKAFDESDPLHAARRNEITTLWRLAAA